MFKRMFGSDGSVRLRPAMTSLQRGDALKKGQNSHARSRFDEIKNTLKTHVMVMAQEQERGSFVWSWWKADGRWLDGETKQTSSCRSKDTYKRPARN